MDEVVNRALVLWGMEDAPAHLVAARENAVYQVATGNAFVAMRLHRRGYRKKSELESELAWVAAMACAGISTAAPVPALNGALIQSINGIEVDVLSWLSGQSLMDVLATTDANHRSDLFNFLGCEMAKLHNACDAWVPPSGFNRVHWDREGLLGTRPLWDRFWDNPELEVNNRALLERFRDHANITLQEHGHNLDYGLIHADLVPNNILVEEARLHLIDFDDGGYGYRLFDIATALLKHDWAPDYPLLRKSLIEGYRSVRPLDAEWLDLFLALRAVTYLGWNISRMDESGGVARNQRFIETAIKQINRYFSNAENHIRQGST